MAHPRWHCGVQLAGRIDRPSCDRLAQSCGRSQAADRTRTDDPVLEVDAQSSWRSSPARAIRSGEVVTVRAWSNFTIIDTWEEGKPGGDGTGGRGSPRSRHL